MKKTLVAIAAVSFASSAFAAGITGSGHDFSGKGYGTTEICRPCHGAHNGNQTIAPLWNHAATTATGFTTYSSSSMQATVGQPQGISLACLSCHDGTVAVDSFGGVTGTHPILSTSSSYLGKNLANDHPVSFKYDDALATSDGSLYKPTLDVRASLGGKTINAVLLFGAAKDQVECASCHDVHNTAGFLKMLVMDNTAASKLCMTCHNK